MSTPHAYRSAAADRLIRSLRVVLAFSLVVLAAPVLAQQESADAPMHEFEAKLQALRNALVDTALEAPTDIRNSAWLDSEGRLHESTRISSGVRVRGVRVNSYIDEAGLLEAQIETREKVYLPAETLFCGVVGQGLKRQGLLSAMNFPEDGRNDTAIGAGIRNHAAQRLLAQAGASGVWMLSNAPQFASSYERFIAGGASDHAPYLFELRVDVEQRPASTTGIAGHWYRSFMENYDLPRRKDAKPVHLALSVRERHSGATTWQGFAAMTLPRQTVTLGQPVLSQQAAALTDSIVDAWLAELHMAMHCAPVYFTILNGDSHHYVINAGYRAGLKVGDKFLLADRARLPGHILEQGALESMVLAEVEWVRADTAQLRRLVGPEIKPHPTLVAMPL